MFFILVCILELHTAKADVTKAFTLADLDRELYCEQMPGIDIPGYPRDKWVCLLHKALEGLKQAGFLWQAKHTKFLLKFGFNQSTTDPCIFIWHVAKGIMLVLVHVDDLSIAFSVRSLFDEFKAAYKTAFPSKFSDAGFDEGASTFTGVTVHRDRERRRICIEQIGHIERAYAKFVPKDFPMPLTPAISDRNSKHHYSKLATAANEAERNAMRGKPYLAALATMMYLTCFTIPLLDYHTSYLGQFSHDPSPAAELAVMQLIAYAYANRKTIGVLTYGGALSIPKSLPDKHVKDFQASHGLYGSSDVVDGKLTQRI